MWVERGHRGGRHNPGCPTPHLGLGDHPHQSAGSALIRVRGGCKGREAAKRSGGRRGSELNLGRRPVGMITTPLPAVSRSSFEGGRGWRAEPLSVRRPGVAGGRAVLSLSPQGVALWGGACLVPVSLDCRWALAASPGPAARRGNVPGKHKGLERRIPDPSPPADRKPWTRKSEGRLWLFRRAWGPELLRSPRRPPVSQGFVTDRCDSSGLSRRGHHPNKGARTARQRRPQPPAAPLTRFSSPPPAAAGLDPRALAIREVCSQRSSNEAPERRVRRAKRWAGLRVARRISSHKPEQLRKCRKVSRLPRRGGAQDERPGSFRPCRLCQANRDFAPRATMTAGQPRALGAAFDRSRTVASRRCGTRSLTTELNWARRSRWSSWPPSARSPGGWIAGVLRT